MRAANIERVTAETEIALALSLDGGEVAVSADCGFIKHMLTLLARHGNFGLKLKAQGDTEVDYHHVVEDIGICLGRALNDALGDRRGIARYGDIILPMDEALVLCAVDISGRGGLYWAVDFPTQKIGDFDTELAREFFDAFAREARLTLHLRLLAGINSHHIAEACFKALGRALSRATRVDAENANSIPSTKGVL